MYNNNPMLGQKVKFTPNGDKATLKITSDFDLSSLIGGKADLPLQLQGPGLLPGTPELTLNVDLKVNGDQCSFEGVGEAEYCTYEYKGTVAKGSLNLQFNNVKLKDTSFVGKWDLLQYNPQTYENDPIHLVWKSEETPIENILKLALQLPLISAGADKKLSATEMLNMVLKDVTFKEDGNIVATYTDVKNPAAGPQTSPVNLAQYVVAGSGIIKVFLNPVAIIAQTQRSKAMGIPNEIITTAIQQLLPLLTNGVPVEARAKDDQRTVLLNTEFLLPLMKGLVAPLFKDEAFVKLLVEAMKKDPEFGAVAGLAESMLKALPNVIEKTEKLEVGLNFTVSK